jgi:hypothetical protein
VHLDLKAQARVHRGRLELPAPRAARECKGLRVFRVRKVHKAMLDCWARPEPTDLRARAVPRVRKGRWARGDMQALKDRAEPRAFRVLREALGRREFKALKDLRGVKVARARVTAEPARPR